jgi:hypothetical protein
MIKILRNIYMESKSVVPKDEKTPMVTATNDKKKVKKPKKKVTKSYTMVVERKEVEVNWN